MKVVGSECSKPKRIFSSFAILLVAGCASQPVAYVGLYGDYQAERAVVSDILGQFGVDIRLLDVDPPTGIDGSVIIHGRSKAAKAAANDIAYALYERFGSWVTVRPVTFTNHEYSSDYIGIYLANADFLAASRKADEHDTEVVPANSYVAQGCDAFSVVLELDPLNTYSIVGSQFDDRDRETQLSIAGTYVLEETELTLEYQGRVTRYQRDQVQHSQQEPMKRDRFSPIGPTTSNPAFECSFLQELDVVARQ